MTAARTTGEHLVAALNSTLTLALLETAPPSDFHIGGVHFRDSGLGDFTGFYDWLRDLRGMPVGVRYCPSAEAEPVLSRVALRSYMRRQEACLEIVFQQHSKIDYSRSDDQSFGGNRIFVSEAGDVAVSFEAYFLSEDELRSIREAPVSWGSVITRARG